MPINEFLHRARMGRVRITLDDGQTHTGSFRTDILSAQALSAYFYGDARDMSLPIDDVIAIESIAAQSMAS